jgi:hypothetical protein
MFRPSGSGPDRPTKCAMQVLAWLVSLDWSGLDGQFSLNLLNEVGGERSFQSAGGTINEMPGMIIPAGEVNLAVRSPGGTKQPRVDSYLRSTRRFRQTRPTTYGCDHSQKWFGQMFWRIYLTFLSASDRFWPIRDSFVRAKLLQIPLSA